MVSFPYPFAKYLLTEYQAYAELRRFYGYFMMMPYDNFKEFCDPANEVSLLLQAHFVAMQLIMTPISKNEWVGSNRKEAATSTDPTSTDGKTGRWLVNIHSSIPIHMLEYYSWTLLVEEEIYNKGNFSYCEPKSPEHSVIS
jgi:hypothetical protein